MSGPENAAASYFILKAKQRDVIESSYSQGAWATRLHTSLAPDAEQPHQRLEDARERGPVVLLFAVDNEHEWVGYAVMGGESWVKEGDPFPYHFDVEWCCLLPRNKGVKFGTVAEAGAVHTLFNADQVSQIEGNAIREALLVQQQALEQQAAEAEESLLASALLRMNCDETEPEYHIRLISHVRQALGCGC